MDASKLWRPRQYGVIPLRMKLGTTNPLCVDLLIGDLDPRLISRRIQYRFHPQPRSGPRRANIDPIGNGLALAPGRPIMHIDFVGLPFGSPRATPIFKGSYELFFLGISEMLR